MKNITQKKGEAPKTNKTNYVQGTPFLNFVPEELEILMRNSIRLVDSDTSVGSHEKPNTTNYLNTFKSNTISINQNKPFALLEEWPGDEAAEVI